MKQYALVSTDNKMNFLGSVDKALQEGWELVGGISVVVVPGPISGIKLLFTQALWRDQPLVQVGSAGFKGQKEEV